MPCLQVSPWPPSYTWQLLTVLWQTEMCQTGGSVSLSWRRLTVDTSECHVYWLAATCVGAWLRSININTLCLLSIGTEQQPSLDWTWQMVSTSSLETIEVSVDLLGRSEGWPRGCRDQTLRPSSLLWLWAMILDKLKQCYYNVIKPLEITLGLQYTSRCTMYNMGYGVSGVSRRQKQKFIVRFPSDCNISCLKITTQSDFI